MGPWCTGLIYLQLNSSPQGLHPALILPQLTGRSSGTMATACQTPDLSHPDWISPNSKIWDEQERLSPKTYCLKLLGCSLHASPPNSSPRGDWDLRPGFHLILGREQVSIHPACCRISDKDPLRNISERILSDHYRQGSKKTNSTMFAATSVKEVKTIVSEGA